MSPKRILRPERNYPREYLSVQEQAARWGVSESQVLKLLRSGELEGKRCGRRWLIPLDAGDKYLKGER